MGGWDVDTYGKPGLDVGDCEPVPPYDAAMALALFTSCGAAEVARALAGASSTGKDGDVWRHFDKRRGLGMFADGRKPPNEQALLYPPVDSDVRRICDGFGPRQGVHLERAEYGALVDLHLCLDACQPGQVCVAMHLVCEEEGGRLRPKGHAHVRKYDGRLNGSTSDFVTLDRPPQPAFGTTSNDRSKTPAQADELGRLFGCTVRVLGPGMPDDNDRAFGWGRYYAVVSNRENQVEGVVECREDELGGPAVWLDGLMVVLATASLREPDRG